MLAEHGRVGVHIAERRQLMPSGSVRSQSNSSANLHMDPGLVLDNLMP